MTETTSLLDVNLDDAQSFRTLPDNEEAKLTIAEADIVQSKSYSDRQNLRVKLDAGADDIDDIYTYLPIPNEQWKGADLKSYIKGVNRFKEFVACFSVSAQGDVAGMAGAQGWCLMSEEEDDRNAGVMPNGIRRFIPAK